MAKRSRPICWSAPTASAPPCASRRLPEAVPLYAGYSAWRALIAENAIPPDIHRDLFEYMSFRLPPGEQFLGYPVAGPDNDLRPGHRRYNVVWYRPADEKTKLQWLLTDERGVTHAISIPPPLIRREAIAEMRADAERLLGAAIPPDRAADRGADPAADLRSRIRRAWRSAGWRSSATRPSSRDRMWRPACRRRRTMPRRWRRRCKRSPMSGGAQALRGGAPRREPPHHRARAPSRRLFAGDANAGRTGARRPALTDGAVIAETAVLDFLYA